MAGPPARTVRVRALELLRGAHTERLRSSAPTSSMSLHWYDTVSADVVAVRAAARCERCERSMLGRLARSLGRAPRACAHARGGGLQTCDPLAQWG